MRPTPLATLLALALVVPTSGCDNVSSSDDWVELDAGIWHTCGIKTDGSIECWGAGLETAPCNYTDRACGQGIAPEGTYQAVAAAEVWRRNRLVVINLSAR